MTIKLKRIKVNRSFLNIYENRNLVLGFTERNFRMKQLIEYFAPYQIFQLKQIHSDIILAANRINAVSEGDGIVIGKKQMAVIKTADCIPLFFWSRSYSTGGILHIGWQGLLKGIEKKLTDYLNRESIAAEEMIFFLGAGIERDCYEVGGELYTKFNSKPYTGQIFSPTKAGKFFMDLKKGVKLSLMGEGIPAQNITDVSICTFCNPDRLPSYRRRKKTADRIYNFLILK